MRRIPQDMLPGTTYPTNQYGNLVIEKYINKRNVVVKFFDTGSITTACSSHIRRGRIKDYFLPTVIGVGYLGDGIYRSKINRKTTKAYKAWENMLRRCYCEKSRGKYPTYKDCTVDNRWLNFQVFAEWYGKNHSQGCDLDKDKLVKGNRIYGPDFCTFISRQENLELALAKNYMFIDPKGKTVKIFNLNKFCVENKLKTNCMSKVHIGISKSHKGWTKA